MRFPIEELLKLEAKYETVNNLDDTSPELLALQKKIRGKTRSKNKVAKRKRKLTLEDIVKKNELKNKVADAINYGYSMNMIVKKVHVGKPFIHKVMEEYNLKIKDSFLYTCEGIHIQSTDNFQYWGLNGKSYRALNIQCKRNNLSLTRDKLYWGDLPSGSKYMLIGDNSNVYVKE